jgi:hypothetical protein
MDTSSDFRGEEGLASPFQPDVVASAGYFEIYERKPGLEPERKLMFAVLQDAITCFQSFVCATDKGRKKQFLKAEEWLNENESDWIFSFENICETLGLDPQYLLQGLLSWKAKRLTERTGALRPTRLSAVKAPRRITGKEKNGQTTRLRRKCGNRLCLFVREDHNPRPR